MRKVSHDSVWAATFGAAFANQVLRRQREGYDQCDPDFLEMVAEEAEAIAELAVNACVKASWKDADREREDG